MEFIGNRQFDSFMAGLTPGDKIVIVDKWVGGLHNWNGEMDEYLGRVLTVDSITHDDQYGYYALVKEDEGRWFWFGELINIPATMELHNNDVASDG